MPSSKKKFSIEEVEGWTTEEVVQWLASVKLEAFKEDFETREVTGIDLLQITGDGIKSMNCTDKRKKAMKKALGSLPGNSLSSKAKTRKQSKQAPALDSGSRAAPPLPRNGPPLPASQGSSRPPIPRGHLPPPPDLGGGDYEDPMVAMNEAGDMPPWGGGSGMIPDEEDGYGEEPTDIYDCVDDLENADNPRPPPLPPPQDNGFHHAPPPPPQDNGFHHAPPPPAYPPEQAPFDDNQAIYEGGDDEGSFADSFTSESESGGDDYLSLDEEPSAVPEEPEGSRTRSETDAIRTLKGRFFAHGLTKHTGISVGSESPKGTARDSQQVPVEEGKAFEDEEFEDEIYDIVPEELKQQVDEFEEPEDIYDIPPEMVEGAPPAMLPPKPKPPPPGPQLIAPPPYGAGDDVMYDDGQEMEEDVYDVPSEVEQQEMNRVGKPPPPPPMTPPLARTPSPIDEDIYDTADADVGPSSSPLLPARPPKSNDTLLGAPLVSRSNKPSPSPSGSPAIPHSPFNRPAMKKPIDARGPVTSHPPPPLPPASPPLSPPSVPLPPRPPKTESSKPPPPPPSNYPHTPPLPSPAEPHPPPVPPPAEPHPPPLPPPSNDMSFQRPPSRTPISPVESGGPPPRPPNASFKTANKEPFSMEQRLTKLSPATKRATPTGSDHSPKVSPLLDRQNLKPVEKPTNKRDPTLPPPLPPSSVASEPKPFSTAASTKPAVGKVPGNKMAASNGTAAKATLNGPVKAASKLTSASVNKQSASSKASRISNLMNRFESEGGGSGGSTGSSTGPSPITSPTHKLEPPKPPLPDVSPLSGRKMSRKESVENLTMKFGGPRTRSPSPVDAKPLPPKSQASGLHPKFGNGKSSSSSSSSSSSPGHSPTPSKPWSRKPLNPPEEKDTPSTPPPAKPWMKKPLGKPAAEKDEPPSAPPPNKPWMKKTPPKPSGDVPPNPPLPNKPWLKKPAAEKDVPPSPPSPSKPWLKKTAAEKDVPPSPPPPNKPWMKKTSAKPLEDVPPSIPPPAKPWMKKIPKPSEDVPPSIPPPAKPWMKKTSPKPSEDVPPSIPPPAKPWMKKTSPKPLEDVPPSIPPPAKPWMKKSPTKPPDDEDESSPPPPLPSAYKPETSKEQFSKDSSSPEMIEEEPPPTRLPPSSAFKAPKNDFGGGSSPGAGKRVPPSPAPGPDSDGTMGPAKKVFTYKPFNAKEHSSASTSGTSSPRKKQSSPVPEEDPEPQRLPGRNLDEALSLPRNVPPPSYRAPPEPLSPPAPESPTPELPGRILSRPPPITEPDMPPSRVPPPSQRAPPEPENFPPSLPTRNPPSLNRPLDPPLPPRPVSSEPAMPSLPERSWKSSTSKSPPELPSPRLPQQLPDLPTARPPSIPSKRAPEPGDPPLPSRPSKGADPPLPSRPTKTKGADPPLPSRPTKGADLPLPSRPTKGADPPLPSRPTKGADPPLPSRPTGSPVGQMWYHANLDRKRAEALLKRYNRDGTFIIRDSTKIAGEYSLSLWFGGGVRHLRIRLKQDKKFVLGEEKSDEHAFETVMDLVAHHRYDVINLRSGGETTLKYECPH